MFSQSATINDERHPHAMQATRQFQAAKKHRTSTAAAAELIQIGYRAWVRRQLKIAAMNSVSVSDSDHAIENDDTALDKGPDDTTANDITSVEGNQLRSA